MKTESIKIRLSERRMHKIRLLAAQQDKTMTQLLEECIDRLPEPSIGNSSDIPLSYQLKS